jgi:hypothetical protein
MRTDYSDEQNATVYRFNGAVAMHTDKTPTVYLSPAMARQIGEAPTMTLYATVNHRGEATPVSTTIRGAKNYATRHGYTIVCTVSKYSLNCYDPHHKTAAGQWAEGWPTDAEEA